MSTGSSYGASHTPTSPRARNASRFARQTGTGTMIAACDSASAPSSRTSVQRSSTTLPSLMSCRGIDPFLEWLQTDPAYGVDEALVIVSMVDISVDQP